MRAYERFMKYVQYDTTSDSTSKSVPSTKGQLVLGKALGEEMSALGLQHVKAQDNGIVWGFLPASPGCEKAPSIGFLAHLDTTPDAPGKGVRPVMFPVYDGENVHLPSGHVIDVEKYPDVKKFTGQTLITASGDTLLGADNKAGIAEIMTMCEEIVLGNLPHGRVCVAFTPDEEIGGGAENLDIAAFGADYAYTVDGGEVGEIEFETFNAAAVTVEFTGLGVHPGAAKGIMVNAAAMAAEYQMLLPAGERPENTSGYEGFYHLHDMKGNVDSARLDYIVRDHDRACFANRKLVMQEAARALEKKYGDNRVKISIVDSYYNMAEIVQQNFHLVDTAREAIRAAGLAPISKPVRGGTDGSQLSFRGLPCPNLGTGGLYFHGTTECISAEAMDKSVEILLGIIERYSSANS